jgi:hypothetical protein
MDAYLRTLRLQHRFLLHVLSLLPHHEHIFLVGSMARQKPRPADLDVLFDVRGLPLPVRKEMVDGATVMLKAARFLYGWCDPFVLNAQRLHVRDEHASSWEPSHLRSADLLVGAVPLSGLDLQGLCPELESEARDVRQARAKAHLNLEGRPFVKISDEYPPSVEAVLADPEDAIRRYHLSPEQVQACFDQEILEFWGFLGRQRRLLIPEPAGPEVAVAPGL